MSFLDTLKSMVIKSRFLDPESQKLRDTLQDSFQIVSDFGRTLEIPCVEDGLGPLLSEKRLPHPKDRILWAISLLETLLASSVGRTEAIRVLSPEQAEYLLSVDFRRALDSAKVMLGLFVPDEALQKQRELAADLAEIRARVNTKA